MAKEKKSKERRSHKRSKPSGIAVTIDGEDFLTQNLSVGGAMVSGYNGPLSAGALLVVTGVGLAGGKIMNVQIQARVNRAIPDTGQLALSFLSVDERAYETLQAIMADKIKDLELD